MEWKVTDYILGTYKSPKLHKKVAGFDLDDTLIKTKSGAKFAKSADDWKLYSENVVKKIKQYHDDNYLIVIFSNQKGIESKKVKIEDWQQKLESICKKIGVPMLVFASIKSDIHRKPFPTMFDILCNMIKEAGKEIELKNSLYCGDAAGRKNDFSDSDYKFALNSGIDFFVPEVFFDDVKNAEKPVLDYPIDIKEIMKHAKKRNFEFESKKKEMVIMVGLPGSGKSSYSNHIVDEAGYTRINRDILKTQKKCVDKCTAALKNGESIVIDNSNASPRARKVWIDLAKQYKYKLKCIEVTTPLEIARHNALYRSYVSGGEIIIVPKIVYNIFKKDYVKPSKKEGFDVIEEIEFKPDIKLIDDKRYKMFFIAS